MRTAGPKVAITLCLTLSATVSLAQSLGDVARQERERRAQLPQRARVITNEDLKQERILSSSPEQGMASSEAPQPSSNVRVEQQAAPLVGPNVPRWAVADQPGFSLGAYARALRQARQIREQQNAAVQAPAPQVANAEQPRAAQPATEVTRAVLDRNENLNRPHAARVTHAVIRNESDPGAPVIRVSRGDSLWRLARTHLGDGRLWPLLWQANPEIANPDRLRIGQRLH